MKVNLVKGFVCVLVFFSMSFFAFAGGDIEKGKALFSDPKLAGGTTGKSCNSCHPGGKGLEKAGAKKEWRMMGKKFSTLEAVINYDIEKALHGKAIDPKSDDMANIAAYIKSLGGY